MGKKKLPHSPVTFRIPADRQQLLQRVAEAKGIDLTAVLNELIADGLPRLERWLSRHEMSGESISPTIQGVLSALRPQDAYYIVDVHFHTRAFTTGPERNLVLPRIAKMLRARRQQDGRPLMTVKRAVNWTRIVFRLEEEFGPRDIMEPNRQEVLAQLEAWEKEHPEETEHGEEEAE